MIMTQLQLYSIAAIVRQRVQKPYLHQKDKDYGIPANTAAIYYLQLAGRFECACLDRKSISYANKTENRIHDLKQNFLAGKAVEVNNSLGMIGLGS